jgi:hypothetical protein
LQRARYLSEQLGPPESTGDALWPLSKQWPGGRVDQKVR